MASIARILGLVDSEATVGLWEIHVPPKSKSLSGPSSIIITSIAIIIITDVTKTTIIAAGILVLFLPLLLLNVL